MRRFGMPTDPKADAAVRVDGFLESNDVYDGRRTTRRLIVRHVMSAPGAGILAELYQPVLVSVHYGGMRLRGIERVRRPEDRVESAVVQEWIVTVAP